MSKQITIKNGGEVRKWIVVGLAVLTLLVGGVYAFSSLQNVGSNNAKDIEFITNEGTKVSRQLQLDFADIKSNSEHTRNKVDKIAAKMGIE